MSEESMTPTLALELDKLKACIHCGMCLPACPTYQATGSEAESPRGRLYLMKKLLEGDFEAEAVQPHLDQCLACHACESVCPSGVQYGRVLLAAREDLAQENPNAGRKLKRWIFKNILPRHTLLVRLGGFLRWYQQGPLQAFVRRSGLLKPLPSLAHQESLLPEIPERRALHSGMSFGNPSGERVVLLIGCVMDVFYNPVHWDTIEVLAANGYYVLIPEQTCCGALAHHAGETDITRDLARRNIDTMLAANPDWIVVNSAGCGSSMQEYGHLLADDRRYAEQAKSFSQKTVDIMALLTRRKLAKIPAPLEKTVTYHAACHLHHVQKVKTEPLMILEQIPGLTLVPLTQAEACCGSAGIYNIEQPELSREILAEKMRHVQAAHAQGAGTLITGNPGCMLQVAKGLEQAGIEMTVQHPISLLAEAYRQSPVAQPAQSRVRTIRAKGASTS